MTREGGSIPKKIERKGSTTDNGMCVDGNWAAAHVSYRTNDCAYIFPITPSSPMGEEVDAWAAEQKKNLWGQELKVVEMQSEGGAAGALHGALVSGSVATTYTASQGLLLFIPNMYKIAGELLPTVIHVASRALAGEALSIYGDHSDTMLVRGCGWAMVSSFSVQEAHDMAAICQMATLNSRVPFLHFFDGFRTSHEVNKITLITDDHLHDLMPFDKIEEHRQRGLSPMHPTQRGTAQAPDIFMQMVEGSNQYYNEVEGHIVEAMEDFHRVTGRGYEPLEYRYYGSSSPRVAIICMGSGVTVIDGTLKNLKSETTCLIAVRMFRPWNSKRFADALPETVTRVAVLDRTREGGSQGEPLYLDVCTSLMQEGRFNLFVAGGRYGLGSKDFTPRMVSAIMQNMLRKNIEDIQRPFTVGITDDVTNLSLPLGRLLNILDPTVTQCVFWGFGSDGTVGANKAAVKMIGNYHRDMSVQAYFEYDAKKSSGWTISHLRFSPKVAIEAPFRVEECQADYVACHNEGYVQANKYDVLKFCKRRGNFFLNTSVASIADPEERIKCLEQIISSKNLRQIAMKNVHFYIMDAVGLSRKYGLAGRINMICQMVFFRLSNVVPLDDAVALLKASIRKTYGYKGDDVIQKNIDLLDAVVSDPTTLIRIDIPESWKKVHSSTDEKPYEDRHNRLLHDEKVRKFMTDIVDPVSRLEGDDIPVSKFLENHLLGGVMIPGTTKFEKRNPNPSGQIPKWKADSCTQCNGCVFICPHAAIRPFVVTKEEAINAPFPVQFETLKVTGAEFGGKRYAIRVSPLDCTGCNACVEACPEEPKALEMQSIEVHKEANTKNWEYAYDLPERGDLTEKNTIRGSQFQTPLMEFSGACSGCGETPYLKLLTQLFGERMVIANATGCSSIWGGSFPSNPYTVSKKTGRGPAWANSLFEDNAEYGLGMYVAMRHRRERLTKLVDDYVHQMELKSPEEKSDNERELVHLMMDWLEVRDEKSDKPTKLFDKMKPLFLELLSADGNPKGSLLSTIWSDRDMFAKISQWIVGGDGWAYDIGFGGLDHVEAFESNDVNVLVVDTEMYSNTGGQMSKATPQGATAKFAEGGKVQRKKNIGEIFMTYEHVYVASVSLANQAQVLQAFIEADRYNGPSIIVAYSPCVQQGVRPQGLNDMVDESRFAVDSGYWPLYRFNPELVKEGKNPFVLDCKKLSKDVTAFLKRESRFLKLEKKHPEISGDMVERMNQDVHHRMEHLKQLASGYKAFDHKDNATVKVLFASETGTAARVARDFADACTLSHIADAMNDVELDEINGNTTIFFIATCGQGAFPQNGKDFYKRLCARQEKFSEGTKFAVFGLGDSAYYFFCEAARKVEARLLELGAEKLLDLGVGDDSAEEGLEEGLHDWLGTVWPALCVPAPAEVPHTTPVKVEYSPKAILHDVALQRNLNSSWLHQTKRSTDNHHFAPCGTLEIEDLADRMQSQTVDESSNGIIYDPSLCIGCSQCVQACDQLQGMKVLQVPLPTSNLDASGLEQAPTCMTTRAGRPLRETDCISCGQCTVTCRTGAIREVDHTARVMQALSDPNVVCVLQTAPSVRVTLAEMFGGTPGEATEGLLVGAAKSCGFRYVFDTNLAADLTIMEEAHELLQRIDISINGSEDDKKNHPLPMFTSCCPGWVNLVEQSYPELIPNLSTCRSPMSMLSSVIRHHWWPRQVGILGQHGRPTNDLKNNQENSSLTNDQSRLFVVAVMPCTAKKDEIAREQFHFQLANGTTSMHETNAVLTVREFARLMELRGVAKRNDYNSFQRLPKLVYDNPFGESTGAAIIFGVTGGVMEAALRTAADVLSGKDLTNVQYGAVRGLYGIKEATLQLGANDEISLNVAVCNQMRNVREFLSRIQQGPKQYHFIEIMTCPGGCIGGGGMPQSRDRHILSKRIENVYTMDERMVKRKSHQNAAVNELYRELLQKPLSHTAHKLLHTRYMARPRTISANGTSSM